MISLFSLINVGRVIPPNTGRYLVITKSYVNNNVDVNVLIQNFAFEHDFTKIDTLLFKPEWMDGSTNYCYRIYLLVYEFENI